jgi:hypothetical protein
MKAGLADVLAVEPDSLGALSIQPENVTFLADCDAELLGGACATSPTVTAQTIAARKPDQSALRIASLLGYVSLRSDWAGVEREGCNQNATIVRRSGSFLQCALRPTLRQ